MTSRKDSGKSAASLRHEHVYEACEVYIEDDEYEPYLTPIRKKKLSNKQS